MRRSLELRQGANVPAFHRIRAGSFCRRRTHRTRPANSGAASSVDRSPGLYTRDAARVGQQSRPLHFSLPRTGAEPRRCDERQFRLPSLRSSRGGTLFYSFAVITPRVTRETGWSEGVVSAAFSTGLLAGVGAGHRPCGAGRAVRLLPLRQRPRPAPGVGQLLHWSPQGRREGVPAHRGGHVLPLGDHRHCDRPGQRRPRHRVPRPAPADLAAPRRRRPGGADRHSTAPNGRPARSKPISPPRACTTNGSRPVHRTEVGPS